MAATGRRETGAGAAAVLSDPKPQSKRLYILHYPMTALRGKICTFRAFHSIFVDIVMLYVFLGPVVTMVAATQKWDPPQSQP